MKRTKTDSISDSSDNDSGNDLQPPETNGTKVENSENSNYKSKEFVSESESEYESDNKEVILENSSNQSSDEESNRGTKQSIKKPGTTISPDQNEEKCDIEEVPSTFNFQDLTPDDEIYMLQCPNGYKMQDLLDKVINFNKSKQTINIKNELNQVELHQFQKKFITLAVPNESNKGTLVKLPFKGQIIIDKVVETCINNNDEKFDVHDKNEVVFPKDIKIRHPLLGTDWEDHIKKANKSIKMAKEPKKHKKIKREKTFETRNDDQMMESLEIHSHVFKRKKAKHK